MALQVTFKYKSEVADFDARRKEGLQAKAEFPAKVPVLIACMISCAFYGIPLRTVGDR